MIFRQRGKVLRYADYIAKNHLNETIKFELNKDVVDVQLDSSCIDAVWGVIESECAGKIDDLKKYLQKGTDMEIGQTEIIKHVIDLVEQYLNNDVAITKGHQHITSLDDFLHKARKLDFVSVVDTLVSRLYHCEDEIPKYADLIIDLLDTDTDIDGDEQNEEEE